MTIKDSKYLIFNKVNGYFEETNGNKYLMLVPTNESKEKIEKYKELLIKIRDPVKSITIQFMRIKSILDDELPLNKMIEIPTITIVVRAVFHENNKYYPQVFLDEYLYKL